MTDNNMPEEEIDITDDDIETERPRERDEDLDEGGEEFRDTGDEA